MAEPARAVALCRELDAAALRTLAARYGVELVTLPDGAAIPGSYWGEPEAGLIGNRLLARPDTPVHSLLHELAHYVCMSPERRLGLDTDAGGDDDEECAVCYLQVVLAVCLPGFGQARCLADMQSWGYSFREGTARRWFDGDGRDARNWLLAQSLLDDAGLPSWCLREEPMPTCANAAQS